MDTGVYLIRNLVSGKVYVGSSSRSLKERLAYYVEYLPRKQCHNPHLQAAWNSYGESAFEFLVIELCDPYLCLDCEQYWIDFYDACNPDKGYNTCRKAGSRLGVPQSEETRRRISETQKGRIWTQAQRDKIRNTLKGRHHTEETKAKMRGRVFSDEHRRRLSESHKKPRT